jgi:hypothetical protein
MRALRTRIDETPTHFTRDPVRLAAKLAGRIRRLGFDVDIRAAA